jgi:hypothetical protein
MPRVFPAALVDRARPPLSVWRWEHNNWSDEMVRRIDEGEKPMPEINPEKVCFIIEMARDLRRRRH